MSASWRRRRGRYVEAVELRLMPRDLRNLQRLMNLNRHAARQREDYLNAFLSRALADECLTVFENEGVEPFPGRVPSNW
jgi:predicted P-loop ATPase/GTPase